MLEFVESKVPVKVALTTIGRIKEEGKRGRGVILQEVIAGRDARNGDPLPSIDGVAFRDRLHGARAIGVKIGDAVDEPDRLDSGEEIEGHGSGRALRDAAEVGRSVKQAAFVGRNRVPRASPDRIGSASVVFIAPGHGVGAGDGLEGDGGGEKERVFHG